VLGVRAPQQGPDAGGELRPETTPGGGLTMVVAVPAWTAASRTEGEVR
jgi:hypothetical protein